MMKFRNLLMFIAALLLSVQAFAQSNSLKLTLVESGTDEPIGFATVSITPKGVSKATKYALTTDYGEAKIEYIKKGVYTVKAELLGYKPFSKEVEISGAVNLGTIKMDTDREQIEAAKVSATGNPIIIKKDTIEYNATSFKTTDNDVLEDLLKKLPGVEVGEDGGITVNGETIKKITIDGKTFFLDDPQLASKNIPAKIVNKLKVIEKKSEQAQFTGIDDGETETVIDLSVKPGMMKGAFGNIMAGGGHDIPADKEVKGDWRYQTAAFLGNFKDHQQLSLVINGNNTNNRGFNDLSGSMMGNMRGGQGGRGRGQGGWGQGNGITTSWMAGVNGAWDLFDNNMDLSGNYLFSHTDKAVEERGVKTVFQKDGENLVYKTSGPGADGGALNDTRTNGHRFGVRLDHKFSENSSILFMPQVNFGNGGYTEMSVDTTFAGSLGGRKVNNATTNNIGSNKNVSTTGFLLFRQRLGKPGRTMTVMARYSFSNNDLEGVNKNETITYEDDGLAIKKDSLVHQNYNSNSTSASILGRVTYTEPIGGKWFIEANYAYDWSRSHSNKETFDLTKGGIKDFTYSNEVLNVSQTHDFGANLMFQDGKLRAQLGISAMPNITENTTTRYNSSTSAYEPMKFNPGTRWNVAPQAMVWADLTDNFNFRLFYRGRTNQPATSKLMPVPDNTDPLDVSFGNPTLAPYFTHSVFGDARYNNKETFFSFNVRLNGQINKDPIVNMIWYNNGAQYSMPFNGPSTGNASIHGFINIPIAKSNFSINNMTRLAYSKSSSFVGTGIDMTLYQEKGYYAFMEDLVQKFSDKSFYDAHIEENLTRTMTITERLRGTYRNDNLELQLQGRTRINKSWYTLSSASDQTMTFNNQVRLGVNWTWDAPGLTVKSEFNYNWYNGYSTYQPSEYVLDAEIQKLLFKKKLTIALKGYDILGQAKNITVTDSANYRNETVNNTLGRYIVLSITYRFGTFDKSKMKGGPMMGGGPRRPM